MLQMNHLDVPGRNLRKVSRLGLTLGRWLMLVPSD